MRITWYGHAAFLLETTTSEGAVRLITDPYNSSIGFAPIGDSADIVTLSHQNPRYHSCLDEVGGSPLVIDGLALAGDTKTEPGDTKTELGITFGAVRVFEDESGEGPNAMVWLESEGLRVLHMGDVGHAISDEQLAACGRVDVLLALAGAGPTIALPQLLDFCERLQPRLVIPMHYGLPQLTLKLAPVDDLVQLLPRERVRLAKSATVEIRAQTLPAPYELLVLESAR